jgi:beta-lactamase class C
MSKRFSRRFAATLLACALGGLSNAYGAGPNQGTPDQGAIVRQTVDAAMQPMIAQNRVPGLAVAVTINGQRHFFDYGLASKDPQIPVSRDTLFELGSVSKTLTATLATYAEARGKLSLTDTVGKHMPELKGTALGDVRLLDLGTHTAGGFPLQVPDDVKDQTQLLAWFRAWKPQFAAGTYRTYANPSIGLLGVIAARSMDESFETLMQRRLFPALGLRRTYITVPAAEMTSYAWGYNREDKPVRVSPGPLANEAYGVKSNAVDMIRFVEVNMGIGTVPDALAGALKATHIGYFRSGDLIQNLIWEQYPCPIDLNKLVAGNSAPMALNAIPASAIVPPMAPRGDALINKSGATNGFGAYLAFVPEQKIGIVMLANKNIPNEARVQAAYLVLSRLATDRGLGHRGNRAAFKPH